MILTVNGCTYNKNRGEGGAEEKKIICNDPNVLLFIMKA